MLKCSPTTGSYNLKGSISMVEDLHTEDPLKHHDPAWNGKKYKAENDRKLAKIAITIIHVTKRQNKWHN